MNPQEEIAAIKAARATKGGRMSNAEKDRIAELNAALEGDDVEAPVEPEEAPVGNGRVICANLTIPTPEGRENVPMGTVVEVPDDFLDAMILKKRMERV